MKRILSFKHWQKKSYKKIIEKQKRIGVIGASKKMGVTHMCLAIANFLGSALKQSVLYIELASKSQLLPVVGDKQINFDGHVGFKYKGVIYVLACDVEEALQLINSWEGHIVIDIAEYSEKTKILYSRCETKIMIGSLSPWCVNDMYRLVDIMKGDCIKIIKIYILKKIQGTQKNSRKAILDHCIMRERPIIEDPFKLKEEDFEPLLEMIM